MRQLDTISVDQHEQLNFWPFEARWMSDFLSSRGTPLDQGAQGKGCSSPCFQPPTPNTPSDCPVPLQSSLYLFTSAIHSRPNWKMRLCLMRKKGHYWFVPCYHSIQTNKRTKWRSVDNTSHHPKGTLHSIRCWTAHWLCYQLKMAFQWRLPVALVYAW